MLDSQKILRYSIPVYFLATSACVIFVRIVPVLHKAFIPYGKTRTVTQKSSLLLPRLADITVPKNWFWHYYLLSTSLSIFCGIQFAACSRGSCLCLIKSTGAVDGRSWLVWGMLFVQGCRRLYETLLIQKLSSAKMWIGHYLIGCAFYLMMNLAVFLEASPKPGGIRSYVVCKVDYRYYTLTLHI